MEIIAKSLARVHTHTHTHTDTLINNLKNKNINIDYLSAMFFCEFSKE